MEITREIVATFSKKNCSKFFEKDANDSTDFAMVFKDFSKHFFVKTDAK